MKPTFEAIVAQRTTILVQELRVLDFVGRKERTLIPNSILWLKLTILSNFV